MSQQPPQKQIRQHTLVDFPSDASLSPIKKRNLLQSLNSFQQQQQQQQQHLQHQDSSMTFTRMASIAATPSTGPSHDPSQPHRFLQHLSTLSPYDKQRSTDEIPSLMYSHLQSMTSNEPTASHSHFSSNMHSPRAAIILTKESHQVSHTHNTPQRLRTSNTIATTPNNPTQIKSCHSTSGKTTKTELRSLLSSSALQRSCKASPAKLTTNNNLDTSVPTTSATPLPLQLSTSSTLRTKTSLKQRILASSESQQWTRPTSQSLQLSINKLFSHKQPAPLTNQQLQCQQQQRVSPQEAVSIQLQQPKEESKSNKYENHIIEQESKYKHLKHHLATESNTQQNAKESKPPRLSLQVFYLGHSRSKTDQFPLKSANIPSESSLSNIINPAGIAGIATLPSQQTSSTLASSSQSLLSSPKKILARTNQSSQYSYNELLPIPPASGTTPNQQTTAIPTITATNVTTQNALNRLASLRNKQLERTFQPISARENNNNHNTLINNVNDSGITPGKIIGSVSARGAFNRTYTSPDKSHPLLNASNASFRIETLPSSKGNYFQTNSLNSLPANNTIPSTTTLPANNDQSTSDSLLLKYKQPSRTINTTKPTNRSPQKTTLSIIEDPTITTQSLSNPQQKNNQLKYQRTLPVALPRFLERSFKQNTLILRYGLAISDKKTDGPRLSMNEYDLFTLFQRVLNNQINAANQAEFVASSLYVGMDSLEERLDTRINEIVSLLRELLKIKNTESKTSAVFSKFFTEHGCNYNNNSNNNNSSNNNGNITSNNSNNKSIDDKNSENQGGYNYLKFMFYRTEQLPRHARELIYSDAPFLAFSQPASHLRARLFHENFQHFFFPNDFRVLVEFVIMFDLAQIKSRAEAYLARFYANHLQKLEQNITETASKMFDIEQEYLYSKPNPRRIAEVFTFETPAFTRTQANLKNTVFNKLAAFQVKNNTKLRKSESQFHLHGQLDNFVTDIKKTISKYSTVSPFACNIDPALKANLVEMYNSLPPQQK